MKLSREGNKVPARNAALRKEAAVPTLCASCVHMLDACKRVHRIVHVRPRHFVLVKHCDGYENIEGQKASA